MIARAFPDLVPEMTCTDISTAEMMGHLELLVRSNVVPSTSENPHGLPWDHVGIDAVIRSSNGGKKEGRLVAGGKSE